MFSIQCSTISGLKKVLSWYHSLVLFAIVLSLDFPFLSQLRQLIPLDISAANSHHFLEPGIIFSIEVR